MANNGYTTRDRFDQSGTYSTGGRKQATVKQAPMTDNAEMFKQGGRRHIDLPIGNDSPLGHGLDLANGDSGLPISPFRSGMAGEDGNYNDAAQEAGSKGNG